MEPANGAPARTLTGPQLTPLIPAIKQFAPITLAFSANGKLIALAGADTNVWGFSTRTGARTRPLPIPGGQFATSLAISPDDRTLAAGTASAAYVWNLATSAPLPVFQHADPSQFSIGTAGGVVVDFTRDSHTLVTSGDDALSAWAITSHIQLFHAFAFRGALSAGWPRVRRGRSGGRSGVPVRAVRWTRGAARRRAAPPDAGVHARRKRRRTWVSTSLGEQPIPERHCPRRYRRSASRFTR